MIRQTLDTTTYSVDLPAGGAYVQVMGGNPRRRSFIISWVTGDFVRVAGKNVGTGNAGYAVLQNDNSYSFTVDKWGPLVTGDLWLASGAGTNGVSVTEIFQVG